jgi:hypothetical protein
MYVPLGLYMHPMGLVCPLRAHLCPLGLNYARWGSIMPLGTLLCSLGVKSAPRLKRARPPPLMCARPPYVCTPWPLLSPLRLIYVS